MTIAIKVGALSGAIAMALLLAWMGVVSAATVFEDYKDNADRVYLFVGGMLLFFAVTVVIATVASGLPQHMSRGELLLSVPIGICLLAGILTYLYYGPPSNSVPAHHRDVTPGALPTPSQGGPVPPPPATVTVGTPLPGR
jgi:hypothetical protein